MTDFRALAAECDASDPLAEYRAEFVPAAEGRLRAYLDGNSLGRPLRRTAPALGELVSGAWGSELIRSWTDGDDPWMGWPTHVGDELGAATLGAASGQTVVADSTTVMLYKLARAAVDAQVADGDRREIVLDTDNFPTDRYVLEGLAAERGCTLRWVETDSTAGITPAQVAEAVGERTALVVMSHVAYRSGWMAEAEEITRIVHVAGGLMLWDLCHSVGSVPVHLDAWGADLAVGCTYKYLNGGPGAPAFGYVRSDLQDRLRQPIQGWMGRRDPFTMGPGYEPAGGVRSFISGTPPILGMVPVRVGLEQLTRAGIDQVREKSIALTSMAIDVVDSWPDEWGVRVASPRTSARRGGHVAIVRDGFDQVTRTLWDAGVIPDYRAPDGIRLGLAPLSTSFTEVVDALEVIADSIRAVC